MRIRSWEPDLDSGPFVRPFCIAVALTMILPVAFAAFHSEPEKRAVLDGPEPNQELFILQVTNTLNVPRSNEVVRYTVTLDNFRLLDPTSFQVRSASTGEEVLSGHLESTVERYPTNFVHKMDIVFQDDFGPLETKNY
ncbi:MAG: hypothetical protein ACE5IJ_06975, partial [Thermoplasmata archaeon]